MGISRFFFHITPEDVASIFVNIITFSDDLHCVTAYYLVAPVAA